VCRENLWPYEESKLNKWPTQEALDDAVTRMHLGTVQLPTLRAIKLSIAGGFPVVLSFSLGRAGLDGARRTGSFLLPSADDLSASSHFVLAVGYDDATRKVTVANSWGPDWGDAGYGDLCYEFFGPTQDTPLESKDVCAGDAWTVRRPADIIDLLALESDLVIHGPRGLRVEGATIANVAELFRSLE
jgi:hypothetical protein